MKQSRTEDDESDEHASNPTDDSQSDAGGDDDQGPLRDVRRAVREIRREGLKAAFIAAAVDGILVLLATNLALSVVSIPTLDGSVPLPDAFVSLLASATAAPPPTTVDHVTLLAVAVGGLAFVAEMAWQARRPTVERFERVNPAVAEALRTARDAVESGVDNRVARALYADVIERLRTTSSLGLVPLRRLSLAIVLILVVSVLSVQVTVAGIQIGALGGSDGPTEVPGDNGGAGGPAPETTPEYGGLESGDNVLGESEDVSSGSENLSAVFPSEGGAGDSSERERSYSRSGLPSDAGSVQPQQAGFEAPEELDDAELIRRYNLEIRSAEEDDE